MKEKLWYTVRRRSFEAVLVVTPLAFYGVAVASYANPVYMAVTGGVWASFLFCMYRSCKTPRYYLASLVLFIVFLACAALDRKGGEGVSYWPVFYDKVLERV